MMNPLKLPTLRALLDTVGSGPWHWAPQDVTTYPHIWELVHPGTPMAVNVFAFGPPLSLQARAIAALHPGVLREASQAEWAAQEARERLLVAQGLLDAVLQDAGAMRPEQGELLRRVASQLGSAVALLSQEEPALALALPDKPARL